MTWESPVSLRSRDSRYSCRSSVESSAASASMAAEYAERFPNVDLQMNALVPGEARTEMNQGSPYRPCAVVSMTLILLSHPNGGPNGRFFYRDGRHMPFTYAPRYNKHLI